MKSILPIERAIADDSGAEMLCKYGPPLSKETSLSYTELNSERALTSSVLLFQLIVYSFGVCV